MNAHNDQGEEAAGSLAQPFFVTVVDADLSWESRRLLAQVLMCLNFDQGQLEARGQVEARLKQGGTSINSYIVVPYRSHARVSMAVK